MLRFDVPGATRTFTISWAMGLNPPREQTHDIAILVFYRPEHGGGADLVQQRIADIFGCNNHDPERFGDRRQPFAVKRHRQPS